MRALVAAAMVLTALSGCTEGSSEPLDAAVDAVEEAVEEDVLTIDSIVQAPVWNQWDWFGHHFFFGSGDSSGTHINTIVYDTSGPDYLLATDNQQIAEWEATWDFPMLGSIGKSDLESTAFFADWNLYQFPMKHGDTWTNTFNPFFSGTLRELTMTAVFSDTIETPQGIMAGFIIEGRNAEGGLELVTNYIPEIRWYSELTYYTNTYEVDPDTFSIRILAMGQGSDWSGVYHLVEAEPLIIWNKWASVLDPASQPPAEHWSFTLDGEADKVYGLIITFAFSGASSFEMVAPDGAVWAQPVHHFEPDPSFSGSRRASEFIDREATAGQWDASWQGQGGAGGAAIFLWELDGTQVIV